ncbi:heme/hemin ABC transporter substrate-binding protein [Pararhizobium arenae]|uniref:heme/hemin ABC transporter substrate-binding protein n=1 Tax=Pararhizobium arenae TaxID=1856850 RepID=UPI00094B39A9|nr:ABC transporter substrate-binding protein [Pararhizobium arenae]
MRQFIDLFGRSPLKKAAILLAVAAPFALPPLPVLTATAFAQQAQPVDSSRLVSIGGAVTEIVYALGEEKRLVGRDSTSMYPEAAMTVPDVGYMRQLSPEGVISTNPTAIISIEGSGPPEALSVIKQSNIAFQTIPDRFDSQGILDKITAVGNFLGVPEKAAALREKVKADLDAAVADAEKRPQAERKRVIFILSAQGGKIMAAGTGTAADGILRLSGVINAAGTYAGYKPLTDEAIIEAKPDVILMMQRGGGHAMSDEDLLKHPALSMTPAAKDKAIVRMDGLQLLGFGPRTASAVRELNGAIYGKTTNASQ